MNQARPTILISANFADGEVYSAVTMGKLLSERGYDVHWLCTGTDVKNDLPTSNEFSKHKIAYEGINNTELVEKVKIPFKLMPAILQAATVIRELKPVCVFGFTCDCTCPVGIAAFVCRVPFVFHEPNATITQLDRFLIPLAKRVLTAVPTKLPKTSKFAIVGNPVREEFFSVEAPEKRYQNRTGSLRVLVLGGCQGSADLNEILPPILERVQQKVGPLCILHQSGKNKSNGTKIHYASVGIESVDFKGEISDQPMVSVTEFIEDIATTYAWADLIIGRAGAITVSEIGQVGVASVLIPDPHALSDTQTKNAKILVNKGAAKSYAQHALKKETFYSELEELLSSRTQLKDMAVKAHSIAKPSSARSIADKLESVIKPELRPAR